jgi:hypothetical protein
MVLYGYGKRTGASGGGGSGEGDADAAVSGLLSGGGNGSTGIVASSGRTLGHGRRGNVVSGRRRVEPFRPLALFALFQPFQERRQEVLPPLLRHPRQLAETTKSCVLFFSPLRIGDRLESESITGRAIGLCS